MYFLLFLLGFTVNVALAFYLAANEKAYAQPWRFLIACLFAILLAFGMELGAEHINRLGAGGWLSIGNDQLMIHLVKLTNLICGAFAGAMAGAAVSNRSKFLYDKKSEALRTSLIKHNQAIRVLLDELDMAFEQERVDPGDRTLWIQKKNAIFRLLARFDSAGDKLRDQLRELGVPVESDKPKEPVVPVENDQSKI